MRCVIYRRVSTEDQVKEGFSLEAQRMRLTAFAESQGWTIVDDYVDEGFSAKNTDRPAMQRLIAHIKQEKFDVVLVYRLDRFVRSVTDLHELLKLMDLHKVAFKSSTEVFDTSSATGRMFITIIGTLAQWERETIGERVFESTMKKVETGGRPGTHRPFGYAYDNGKLVINEEEAKWVAWLFDKAPAIGPDTLAKQLNQMGVLSRAGKQWIGKSVKYILTNPLYKGIVRWNYRKIQQDGKRVYTDEVVESPIDQEDFVPLISEKQFDLIQKILESRSVHYGNSAKIQYPFSSIVRCAKCGRPLAGRTNVRSGGRLDRTYFCPGRKRYGDCDLPTVPEPIITQEFLKALDYTINNLGSKKKKQVFSQLDLERKHKQLALKKERSEELYIEGNITKQRYRELLSDIQARRNEAS